MNPNTVIHDISMLTAATKYSSQNKVFKEVYVKTFVWDGIFVRKGT